MQIRSVNMDFLYGTAFGAAGPDAYERLMLDACAATRPSSPAATRSRPPGRIVTPILRALGTPSPRPEFPNYEAGTWGPPEADALIERDGRRWRRL